MGGLPQNSDTASPEDETVQVLFVRGPKLLELDVPSEVVLVLLDADRYKAVFEAAVGEYSQWHSWNVEIVDLALVRVRYHVAFLDLGAMAFHGSRLGDLLGVCASLFGGDVEDVCSGNVGGGISGIWIAEEDRFTAGFLGLGVVVDENEVGVSCKLGHHEDELGLDSELVGDCRCPVDDVFAIDVALWFLENDEELLVLLHVFSFLALVWLAHCDRVDDDSLGGRDEEFNCSIGDPCFREVGFVATDEVGCCWLDVGEVHCLRL